MTPPKAKDGRETLQERATKTATDIVSGWIDGGDMTLSPAQRVALVTGITAALMTSERNALDAAQAEIARLTAKYEPDHTDLMVSPESLDAFLADNPLPDDATPLSVAKDVVEQTRQAFESFLQDIISCVTAGYRLGFEYQRERMFREMILPLLRQPEAAPEVLRQTLLWLSNKMEGFDNEANRAAIRGSPGDEDYFRQKSALLKECFDFVFRFSAPTPASAQDELVKGRAALKSGGIDHE